MPSYLLPATCTRVFCQACLLLTAHCTLHICGSLESKEPSSGAVHKIPCTLHTVVIVDRSISTLLGQSLSRLRILGDALQPTPAWGV